MKDTTQRVTRAQEFIVGYRLFECKNPLCRFMVPSILISKGGVCYFCLREKGRKKRKLDPYMTKAHKTIVRHAPRLGIDREVLINHYGWDVQRLRDDLERAVHLPCPYCLGLQYGRKNEPMLIQGLGQISLDVQTPKEPYYNNCRWVCQPCNCTKRDTTPEFWQLYCSHYEGWVERQCSIGRDLYFGTLFQGAE